MPGEHIQWVRNARDLRFTICQTAMQLRTLPNLGQFVAVVVVVVVVVLDNDEDEDDEDEDEDEDGDR